MPQQVPEALRHRIVELEASVESRFAQHRGEVAGRSVDDNEIKRILRESDDVAERREAWEASKTVGAAVADDVRELARLRNEAARSLGYRDWFALAVATSEMDETRLFETLDECDRLTGDAFAAWKAATDARLAERFGCAVDELRPWHYEDPFFQEVPAAGGVDLSTVFAGKDVVALARATYDGIGVDTGAILDRSDLFPRDGKCQHAFCIDVDREGDVRVLANVADDRYWADTMLHELGHGAYDIGFDRALPWLLRDCHLTVTEGIAILMGRLAQDARVAPRGGRARPGRCRAARGRPARGAGRGAPRLHALGARDDELRARVLRRPRGRPRRPLVGARVALPAAHASRTAATSPTGPRRSTSPARRSTTTRISTGTSSRRSSARRSTGSPAASSAGARPARSSPSRCSGRASRCAGTELIEAATGEPLTATHAARDIAAGLST